jgi:hypothetical protein
VVGDQSPCGRIAFQLSGLPISKISYKVNGVKEEKMQKSEEKDNSGECVFCVAGSYRGIRISLLGPRDHIISILGIAMKSSGAVREIIGSLDNEKSSNEDNAIGKKRLMEEKHPEGLEVPKINLKR